MDGGYIKLYRKSLENGWLQNHNLWVFWTYCLLKATHKKHKQFVGYEEVILKPGQFVFGRVKAASETGLTEAQIRSALAKLKLMKNLTSKSTNKYTVITICNWKLYQEARDDK